ncbi:MAG: cytidylate kinase-like family protein [Planctomycetes bacterium]|nr:cytidylate kinase-like family protein [Planctomycetota bacterium]
MIHSSGGSDLLEPPLHGNQGDREMPVGLKAPLGLTVAISREAGARGGSIARRVGKRLGWQVYTQELLEFLTSNESARSHVLADVPKDAATWADSQLERLRREKILKPGVELGEMPRLILTLASRGRVILVGRGAGYLLPRETTLHVRVVAPLSERVAYMAQWLRRTHEDAAMQVHERDEQRVGFLVNTFNRHVGEMYDHDLVLNSFLLGEELCADLVHMAVRGKEGNSDDV